MLDPNDPLDQRITTTEGTRPAAAPIPEPGIYWLKTTRCGSYWVDKTGTRLDRPAHNEIWSVHTWDIRKESDWFLALVESSGDNTILGSDETERWERKHSLVTRVGPRVEPPD